MIESALGAKVASRRKRFDESKIQRQRLRIRPHKQWKPTLQTSLCSSYIRTIYLESKSIPHCQCSSRPRILWRTNTLLNPTASITACLNLRRAAVLTMRSDLTAELVKIRSYHSSSHIDILPHQTLAGVRVRKAHTVAEFMCWFLRPL